MIQNIRSWNQSNTCSYDIILHTAGQAYCGLLHSTEGSSVSRYPRQDIVEELLISFSVTVFCMTKALQILL